MSSDFTTGRVRSRLGRFTRHSQSADIFCQAERLKTQHEPRLETPSTYVTEMCRVVQVRCTDPQKTMVARALVDSDILISHQSLSLSSASISTGSAR